MIPKAIKKRIDSNHLTNNPVERWFGILKNSILNKRKVAPSEYVAFVFDHIASKYFSDYPEHEDHKKELKSKLLVILLINYIMKLL